ncbi:uncharacterized protein TM35_000024700 [Trypanosoma theileri]|uniref:Uncharacterized protein n=1 Tax=Trypanosoma theileri TaxID=67003 RepID=A0A1X0P888_9TRYP|nr:uncharacterized protein TM35_000024700 [Trypanosoma theileri]ORC93144.1 hypothetical protein TM35_000024700 [Trypanosoma theileri]
MSQNVLQTLALVLLSLLLVSAEHTLMQTRTNRIVSRGTEPSVNAPYFLFSVCEAEIQQFCPSQKEAPLKCLLHHFSAARQNPRGGGAAQGRPHLLHAYTQQPQQTLQPTQRPQEEPAETQPRRPIHFGKECSSWLRAREVCVTYVRRSGRCRASETARECLRRVPASLLPPGCRNTDYHRSVMLYGEMKRQKRT